MRPTDYPAVRDLLPKVSRCREEHSLELVAAYLSLPTYHAFCCFTSTDPDQPFSAPAAPAVAAATTNGHDGPSTLPADFDESSLELVGYGELYLMPHMGRGFDGRLERVVVSEGFRGRGLATALCEHIIEQARGPLACGRVDLTVENPAAKHIYTKLGFEDVQTKMMRLML
ncbi:unnamed protein product [Vitrella brassicaformis CCMP3155]|uniref:N-acetyltransferase domain-containing protein n=1 Tax=Vitrella brassicaformis (strain CCMP3155) TaxID=1169540 RepID=A0A0G4EPA3_VITBC|nr:unnamed protein product [Vitrella brassicaformis CCMP3155]|eukprot:CEL99281.1 unnamed protein product [Vitrella brassicaformis CCMP3155]